MTEEKKDGKMKKDDYWGMYVFECFCGARMATNGQRLSEAIAGAKYFKCPNQFYNLCKKTYAAEHFKRVAEFTPASIPASLR